MNIYRGCLDGDNSWNNKNLCDGCTRHPGDVLDADNIGNIKNL